MTFILREWESTINPIGLAIGFGVNQIFRVSKEAPWYVSYQPTTPDAGTDETALMYDSWDEDDSVLVGDHRKEVSAIYRTGGIAALEEYFKNHLKEHASIFNTKKQREEPCESKFTPGPWLARKGNFEEPERWIIVSGGKVAYVIATIENGAPGDTLETEGHTADLVGAAPDLLKDFEEIVRLTPEDEPDYRGNSDQYGRSLWRVGQVARAAIAKAEGRQS